jgi:arginine N-succinyltransferase
MEMVRAVEAKDLDALLELAEHSGSGLTTLQVGKEQLHERIERSIFAFSRKATSLSGEPFVLVMEDLSTGRLVGTASIYARTGGYEPFYAYRIVRRERECLPLKVRRTLTTLEFEKIHDGPSEIGSLLLLPAARGKGRGRLLSLSRFALIAQRPAAFSDSVIAEMRGVSDKLGGSPVWDAIGRHFFGMDFQEADALSSVSKRFIKDLMPESPVYLDLLPADVKVSLGLVHPDTRPALAILESEGFVRTDLVDIFDGGPLLQCARDAIEAVRRCRKLLVGKIVDQLETTEPAQIVSTQRGGFRAVLTTLIQCDDESVGLCRDTANALQVSEGESVWTMQTKPHSPIGSRPPA